MSGLSPAYLSSITVVGGEPCRLASAGEAPAVTRSLLKDGFAGFLHSDRDLVGLISQAAAGSLGHANVQPQSVDSFMVVTETFWDTHAGAPAAERWHPHERLRERLMRAFRDLGLVDAVPYANWLSACGNLGPRRFVRTYRPAESAQPQASQARLA